jgi:hypothetical protein
MKIKLVFGLFLVMTCFLGVFSQHIKTISFDASEAPLKNPGKGWVIYADNSPLEDYSEEALLYASVGVCRWEWSVFEPEEGKYRWDLIDQLIYKLAQKGIKANIGIMCANSGIDMQYVCPKWVFDAGAKYRYSGYNKDGVQLKNGQYIQEFDDSIYMAKIAQMHKAMAARYDGNPNIEYIDIRTYGNWGEQHMAPWFLNNGWGNISTTAHKKHLQIAIEAFKKTRICVPWGVPDYNENYDWAVKQGVLIRRDGIMGNSNGIETLRCVGYTPGVFEMYGDYRYHTKEGHFHMTTKTKDDGFGYGYSDCIERGKPSYVSLGQSAPDAEAFLKGDPAFVKKFSNRIGYHFLLNKVEFPSVFKIGNSDKISFTWENRGVAYIYIPCYVGIGLMDKNNTVRYISFPDECKPSKWEPDQVTLETAELQFPGIKEGQYRLLVGLFQDIGNAFPTIKLGIDEQPVNGWYVLGEVEVINSK